jgi:hypothetical protein
VDLPRVTINRLARQRDRQTREIKYVVRGQTLLDAPAEAVAKIAPDGTLFVITVYRA